MFLIIIIDDISRENWGLMKNLPKISDADKRGKMVIIIIMDLEG